MAAQNVAPHSLRYKSRHPAPRTVEDGASDYRPITWGHFIRTVERCRRILDDETPVQLVPRDGEPAT